MNTQAATPGRLFILSAPSGAGKTTLSTALRRHFPDLRYSVSSTTRAPRPGERDGVEYNFINTQEFEAGIAADQWVEWARVYGNYYGTSARFIDACLAAGERVLLDIDVQGTDQIVARYPRAITIFIMPPSLEILRDRLESRGSDAPEVILRRLAVAEQEMGAKNRYNHVIVNDIIEDALARLIRIVNQSEKSVKL